MRQKIKRPSNKSERQPGRTKDKTGGEGKQRGSRVPKEVLSGKRDR